MALAVVGTPVAGTSTPGTLSYTVPLPSGVTSGELLIVQASRYIDTLTTGDTGWTKRFQVSGGSNNGRHSVFTKVADGTETVLNLTGDGSYNDKIESHVTFRVSGQHASDYWRDTITSVATTATPNPPNNDLGGTAEEYLWIAHYGAAGSRTHSAYPTDYTGLGAAGGGSGSNGALIGIAYRLLSATAEDPGAFTISASTFTVAGTFAIRPAAGGGGVSGTATGSLAIGGSATGAVSDPTDAVHDTSAITPFGNIASGAHNHTVGAGSNRLLVAAIVTRGSSPPTHDTVTFTPNGGSATAMRLVGSRVATASDVLNITVYALNDADVDLGVGVGVLDVVLSGAPSGLAWAIATHSFINASQDAALHALVGNDAGDADVTSISTDVTSTVDGCVPFDFFATRNNATGITVGANQTQVGSDDTAGSTFYRTSIEAALASPGTATMSWSWTTAVAAAQYAGLVAPAVVAVSGTASGSLSISGSATATVAVEGSATGTLAIGGSAAAVVGNPPVTGTASGTLSFAGTATGLVAIAAIATGSLALGGSASAAVGPTVTVDTGTTHQTMAGWEVTAQVGQDNANYLNWRDAAVTAAAEMGVDRVRLELRAGAENPTDWYNEYLLGNITLSTYNSLYRYEAINDNADPNDANLSGFHFTKLDETMDAAVLPLKAAVEALGRRLWVNLNYVAFSTGATLHTDPDEYAELMSVTFAHMQSTYGFVPDSIEIILEPDNGTAFDGTEIGNCIAVAGARLAAEGYTPEFIGPSTMSMALADNYFDAMWAVTAARPYIKEISYHRYAGVSDTNLANIKTRVTTHGVKSAMLEWIGATAETLWADLTKANCSAWQQFTLAYPTSDNGAQLFTISGSTPVKGSRTHGLELYFKHVRRGAVRIGATSTNASVRPVAFQNPWGTVVTVLHCDAAGDYVVAGLPAGRYDVTRATTTGTASALGEITVGGDGRAFLTVPSVSIVSIAPLGEAFAVGSLSVGGSATATVEVTGTVSGSLAITGTATAEVSVVGTATGSLSLGGSATAAIDSSEVTGSASGSLTVGGSAAGTVVVTATGSGSLALSGSATGSVPVDATGAGAIAFAGSAAATVPITATATGSLSLTGSAAAVVGNPPVSGSASGSLAFAGSATGEIEVTATATGSLGLTGAAQAVIGNPPVTGTASGTLALGGSATGAVPVTATASGSLALSGTAGATTSRTATASGTLSLTGAASATVAVAGTASGALVFAGSATATTAVAILRSFDFAILTTPRYRVDLVTAPGFTMQLGGVGMQTPKYLTMSRDNDLTTSVFLSSEHGLDPTLKTVTAALYLSKTGTAIADPDTTATVTEITTTPATRRQYRIAIDQLVVNDLLTDNPDVTVYWMRIAETTGTARWVKVTVDEHPEIA